MGTLSRRDFIKASSALLTALGGGPLLMPRDALGLETDAGGVPVVWLQAQACTGCSVSLLNSIHYGTIEGLLTETLDVQFHPTLMAASGSTAVSAAEKAYRAGGYVLVVEGAVPIADGGRYCYLWDGLTAAEGVRRYAKRAAFIVAVGTCACFGGMAAGAPNPTSARGLATSYEGTPVVKIPGCPVHPDWLVGTIAFIIANGRAPALDSLGRPTAYFGKRVHDLCPYRDGWQEAHSLAVPGCLKELGCRGPETRADCPKRKWNAASAGGVGVSWCAEAGSPCIGCTEPRFPDGMSPFYELSGESEHDD